MIRCIVRNINVSLLSGDEWPPSCSGRLTPGGTVTGTRFVGGRVGPGADLGPVVKKKCSFGFAVEPQFLPF
jgi:hypothetical protein